MGTKISQSVVIPTSGDILRLTWVLAGLLRQEGAPSFEVIVCADTTKEALADVQAAMKPFGDTLPYRLFSLPVKAEEEAETLNRQGAARNLGIRNAQGEQIVFLDQDCMPDADCLSQHWDGRKTGLLYGFRRLFHMSKVYPYDGQAIDDAYFRQYSEGDPRRQWGGEVFPGCWYTCNASAPTKALLEVGGFDESLPPGWGAEDIQLACRLRDNGAKFGMLTGGMVTHLGHLPREGRPDNAEIRRASIRGEYGVVANGGPLVPFPQADVLPAATLPSVEETKGE